MSSRNTASTEVAARKQLCAGLAPAVVVRNLVGAGVAKPDAEAAVGAVMKAGYRVGAVVEEGPTGASKFLSRLLEGWQKMAIGLAIMVGGILMSALISGGGTVRIALGVIVLGFVIFLWGLGGGGSDKTNW